MKYFYHFSGSTAKRRDEQITKMIDLPQTGESTKKHKPLKDSLIVQFVAAFSDKYTNYEKTPVLLTILLKECCLYPSIDTIRHDWPKKKEQVWVDPVSISPALRAQHNRNFFRCELLNSSWLQNAIMEWWNDTSARTRLKSEITDKLPLTLGVSIDELCNLIVASPSFRISVALYIDTENQENDPVRFFSHSGPWLYREKSALSADASRIRLLYKFIQRYWLDGQNVNSPYSMHACLMFLRDYLGVDVPGLALTKKGQKIGRTLNRIMLSCPEYTAEAYAQRCSPAECNRITNDQSHTRAWMITYRKAEHSPRSLVDLYDYFHNHSMSSVDMLRLALRVHREYIFKKDVYISGDQRADLEQLRNLLPYISVYGHNSGTRPTTSKNLKDPLELSPTDIFAEFELRCAQKDGKEAELGYQFSDYFEACCISLFVQMSTGKALRKCTLCGRYYIPNQNRTSTENYCYRIYPRKRSKEDDAEYMDKERDPLTCSQYHSHSVKPISGSSEYQTLVRFVNNTRSAISKNKFDPKVSGSMNNWLITIRKHAKACDKNGISLETAISLVEDIQAKRKALSDAKRGSDAERQILESISQIPDDASFDVLVEKLLCAK